MIDAHPIANIYPFMTDDELQALKSDIAHSGLLQPIVLLDGLILDGRNRYRAVMELREMGYTIEPSFVPFEGTDPTAFVHSLNFHRRHLSVTQKACIGVEYKEIFQQETKHGGDRRSEDFQGGNISTLNAPTKSRDKAASMVGVSGKVIDKVDRVKKEAPAMYDAMKDGGISVWDAERELNRAARQDRRETNRQIVAQAPSLEQKLQAKFATIMIDPPWDFSEEGDKEVFGRTNPTYATMTDDEIAALPIGTLADDDCHLYMWITNRSLLTGKGARFLEAWGFRFVTVITWCKPTIGVGNYFRNNTEHLVFGVKGSQSLKVHNVGTWFQAPRGDGGHSSKPVEAYELIESCSPGPYLEIFSRRHRADWTTWGEGDGAAL